MIDPKHLLTDEQMRHYLANGFLVLKTGLPRQVHDDIYRRTLEVFDKEGNPGNNILPRVPQLHQVFQDPVLRGALTSVLGPDHIMHSHRHCHVNKGPGEGGGVHKDSYWGYQRLRNHRTRWAMLFYYPQDAPEEIGPTGIVPGSQIYEQRESWEPLEDILPCVGEAGTAVLVHFDIWHRACPNLTDRTRFMMKFQFTRMSEPTEPTWNHGGGAWPGSSSVSGNGNGAGGRHRGVWSRLWDWHRGVAGASGPEPATGAASAVDEAEALARLRAGDLTARLAGADALGRPGAGDAALTGLAQGLGDAVEGVRLNAAYALAAVGPAAVEALADGLGSDDEATRLAAAHGLAALGPAALPVLTAAGAEATDAVPRGSSPDAAGAVYDPEDRQATRAAGDDAASRRGLSAFALGELGAVADTGAAEAVAGLAHDADAYVRRAAADALGAMGQHADVAVPALTTLLADPAPQVRFDAAYGLARQGAAAAPAVDALAAALGDGNRYVRNHAAEALKRIGTPAATAALLEFLEVSRWCPVTTKDSTF